MGTPRKTRGEYRPIYEALFYGKDFRALSVHGKLALITTKGLCGSLGIKSWPGFVPALAEIMGVSSLHAKKAVAELVAAGWIEHEDGVVWVVRGLEFEPQLTPKNTNHKQSVREESEGLPSAPIVERFFARYSEYFDQAKGYGMGDGMGDAIPHGMGDPSPPLPNPSMSSSWGDVVDPSNMAHLVAMALAANTGITEQFGERVDVVRAGAGVSSQVAEAFAREGVPLAFAERTLFDLGRTKRPSDGTAPVSLRWFEAAVLKAWRVESTRMRSKEYRPPNAPEQASAMPHGDPLYFTAIRQAKAGDAEWQKHCLDHGYQWETAA